MQAEAAGVRVQGSRPQLYRVRRSRPGLARKPKVAAAASWPATAASAFSRWLDGPRRARRLGRSALGRAHGLGPIR
jgi:hypothetical protein